MGFLNPLFLFGVATAAIPLFVHLWSRRQARTMDFSTLRFLLEAHRRTVRRFQFEQWLVLLLRMLTLACIAIALARPVLRAGRFFADTHVRTTAAIVLDNSASMGYDGVAAVPFDQAKLAAVEVLRSLNKGDEATLILASDTPTVVFDPALSQLARVEQAARAAELSQRTTQLDPALRRATDLLARSDAPNRELYVISDFAANGWTSAAIDAPDVRVFCVPIQGAASDNVGITSMAAVGAFVAAGLPTQFDIVVRNFGSEGAVQRGLRLFVNDELSYSTTLTLPPEVDTRERISQTFDVAGLYHLRAELDADRLTVDDSRRAAVAVLGQLDVSVVGSAPGMVTLALNPTLTSTPDPAYTIRPAAYAFDTLTQRSLDAADVLVAQDVPMDDAGAMGRVRNHLLQGKPALVFLGAAVQAADLNAVDWMPVTSGGVRHYSEAQRVRPAHLSQSQADARGATPSDAVFGLFDDSAWDEGGAPSVYGAHNLTARPGAVVLARLTDGTPFVVSAEVGGGKVIVVNSPGARSEWSDLALQPAFLPLVQQLVFYGATPTARPRRRGVRARAAARRPARGRRHDARGSCPHRGEIPGWRDIEVRRHRRRRVLHRRWTGSVRGVRVGRPTERRLCRERRSRRVRPNAGRPRGRREQVRRRGLGRRCDVWRRGLRRDARDTPAWAGTVDAFPRSGGAPDDSRVARGEP